jgi:hypothetical protein
MISMTIKRQLEIFHICTYRRTYLNRHFLDLTNIKGAYHLHRHRIIYLNTNLDFFHWFEYELEYQVLTFLAWLLW